MSVYILFQKDNTISSWARAGYLKSTRQLSRWANGCGQAFIQLRDEQLATHLGNYHIHMGRCFLFRYCGNPKYHYNFWRPITAIRNGDRDDNDATEREATWVPFIDTPLHPEYPCAHCILSATVATVLHAEVGGGGLPTLRTTSLTAPGMERSWTTIEAFMHEVAQARIYGGVHYRTWTDGGSAMCK